MNERYVVSVQADRWRPVRAGICNVWEYDDQVFEFADGRMILRGPNGSGKSNALALLFPFLIDGVMSAAAMDPFAGGRSMKSLLLGTVRDDAASAPRYRHDQRLGYVWMELERGDEHVTVGCGARANAQRDARSWFFVTGRRVGIDLDLAPGGEPLTRGRLAEELGADAVCDSAEEHRAAVDRTLYGLGAERLAKLVGLIRVLRRPQLAGKLDLELLSTVLSDGLPAVDPAVLDDVAASFDDLEATQRELADLRSARTVIDAFLPTYLAYLRGETARRAAAVLDGARRVRRAHQTVTETDTRVSEVAAALETNRAERDGVARRIEELDGERDGVLTSEAYQAVTQLHDLEESARREREHAVRAEARRATAETDATDAAGRADERAAEAREATSDAVHTLTLLTDAADAAGVAWTIATDDATDPQVLDRAVRTLIDARRHDLDTVAAALKRADRARAQHRLAEAALAAALEAADDADSRLVQTRAALDDAIVAVRDQVEQWCADAPGIDDAARQEIVEWVGSLAELGAASLRERYLDLVAAHRATLVETRTRAEVERRSVTERRSATAAERDAVAAEVDPGPPAPTWRDADRSKRVGAPLWACCDFADDVAGDDRAGLEAALDAAGLLDAWITPAAHHDADAGMLDARFGPSAVSTDGPTLADVLVAAPPAASGLNADEVTAVLASVGLGDAGIAVDRRGGFVLGPLHGRAVRSGAEYIGAPARAERRRRRLAELDARLAELDAELTRLDAALDQAVAGLEAIDAAAGRLPDTRPVSDAAAQVTRASAEADARRDAAEAAARREEEAGAEATVARAHLDAQGAAHRCPIDDDGLSRLARLIDAVANAAGTAVGQRRAAIDASRRSDEAAASAAAARRRMVAATEEVASADRSAGGLEARVDTLRRQLGPDADAPLVALERIDADTASAKAEAVRLDDERGELREAVGQAKEAHDQAVAAVEDVTTRLASAAERLVVLRRADLLALLDPDTSGDAEGERPADPEGFARWLAGRVGERAPAGEETEARRKALDKAARDLLNELRYGHDPSIGHDDELVVVEVTAESGVLPLARLATELADQQERLESYLSERDREIFERYLPNQVAHALRRLLNDADEFVAGVNEALATARTASGLRVELDWVLGDDSAPVRDAVRLLRRDTAQMGEEDRGQLRGFFDRVIREQRALDPTAGYRAALDAALDYRQWHVFRPVLRTAQGTRTQLTRARFRELSGGEQAVALHLPLFAAAAAHYARAGRQAPRIIALDEAFAGIDEAMRGELMGLVVRFDLDVIMTGHELWGAYAEVPAIAIHDLLRRPPLEGVSVVSFRWDGAAMTER